MKYGFTPGFGSTLVFPEKLGFTLAEDMLLSARTFRGADLVTRGVSFEVLPRSQVLERAIDVAQCLAEKPRLSLVTLKSHLVRSLRDRLPQVIEQELVMHNITFHQPEVGKRLIDLYDK
jgi:polyketide biosynthesis enoyl-CoA hydratase PksI